MRFELGPLKFETGSKVAQVMEKSALPNLDPFFFIPSSLQNLGVTERPAQMHAIVHACIQAITQAALDIPVVMDKKDKASKPGVDKLNPIDHPIFDLFSRPNSYMSGTNFWEAIFQCLLLPTARTPGGQAFLIGSGMEDFSRGEMPAEIYVFDDSLISPILDSLNRLAGWKLGFGNSVQELSPDQVVRINFYNKYDWKLGMSPMCAAMAELTSDQKAKEWNIRFLENFAMVPGMISIDGSAGPPDQKQWKELQNAWAQNQAGSANAGKTAFMPWMLKYQELARSHVDFSFMEQLKWNQETILKAFRLNKWAIGDSDKLNYATAREAKRQMYDNVVLPLLRLILTEINQSWVNKLKPGNLNLRLNLSKVPALKEDTTQRLQNTEMLISMGIPAARALEYFEIDVETDDLKHLQDSTTAPEAVQAIQPATPPKLPDTESGEEAKAAKPVMVIVKALEGSARVEKSAEYVKTLFEPGEKELVPITKRFFISQRNAMLDKVDELFSGDTVGEIHPSEILPNPGAENKRIARMFMNPMLAQVKRTIVGLRSEIPEKAIDLNSTQEEIRKFVADRLMGLSEINDTTFKGVEDRLADVIAEGMADHAIPEDLKNRIKAAIREVYATRDSAARTIARTETAVITSGVRYEVFNAHGIKKQEWLSAHDDSVRPDHQKEDGHVIDVGGEFPVTGLRYPCDPNGEPEEVINCRCVAIPSGVNG